MHMSPMQSFAAICLVGGLAGVAALVNSTEEPITARRMVGAFLFSGLGGMGAAMLGVRHLLSVCDAWGWYIAAGCAVVAGLGGGKAWDVMRGAGKQ